MKIINFLKRDLIKNTSMLNTRFVNKYKTVIINVYDATNSILKYYQGRNRNNKREKVLLIKLYRAMSLSDEIHGLADTHFIDIYTKIKGVYNQADLLNFNNAPTLEFPYINDANLYFFEDLCGMKKTLEYDIKGVSQEMIIRYLLSFNTYLSCKVMIKAYIENYVLC